MTSKPLRILCVDDHALLLDGLEARLDLEADMTCIGRLSTATSLVAECERLRPDVVLLDIEMPGSDPFDAIEACRRRVPTTRVLILSAHVRDHYISMAFRAGAWGYFSKSEDPDDILRGIRRAAGGEFALGPKVAARCRPGARAGSAGRPAVPQSRLDTLTSREREVLRLIGKGMSRVEIAEALCRSPKTVDGHRERIMAKLDLHTAPDLIRFAIREGMVEA